jgi:hypothetical protein
LRTDRSLIAIVVVIGAMLAGAGALYAYDHHRRDVIAEGVTVAGIDLGGVKAAEARSRLHRRYEQRLRRPVVASFHGRRFTLFPAANIKPRVHYSQAAVGELVGHVQRSLDQTPRDATLRVYQNLKLTRSYPIAVGMQGLETPVGLVSDRGRPL